MLAFVAMDVALPRVISAVVLACNMALFLYMALDDERVLAKSPLAEAFADYRKRVGMFLLLPRRS
jgi:protein-S-isoprenylcysteine O-methyltransferase Ste14